MTLLAPTTVAERIVLAHGGGGELMQRLLREHVLEPLSNDLLAPLTDAALVPWSANEVVLTTDSYVVTPVEFPGGDIGRLAVAGTVNDLAVMGARPVALSLALILEEGLPLDTLDRVVASIAATAREAGVRIATGDTKVIERRSAGETTDAREPEGGAPLTEPGLFINTAGIGAPRADARLGIERIRPADCILVNGPIAEHGLAVLAQRNGVAFHTPLRSDAAPLYGLIATMLDHAGEGVRFLRDATRGGVAGVLADIAEGAGCGVEIRERAIPVARAARHAAAMFGLDPLVIANEGKVVGVVAPEACDHVLAVLRDHPLGRGAACIGAVTAADPPLVELITRCGGRRIVQRPYGEELPRIC
ncbi:MAG: hydrogenase expression/formation protein HypE [Phycisphaerae bacterium]